MAMKKGYKQTEIGVIPEDWETRKLVDCVRSDSPICYGILMPGEHIQNGVPVIKVRDITDGRIAEDQLLLTHPKIDAAYSRSRLLAGDLLITIRGTTGRVAIVPSSLSNSNITQDTARIRTITNARVSFLFFIMQCPTVQKQIALHTVGQAVKGINIRDVKRIEFPLPPILAEQEAIAGALSDADAWIESLEQLIAKKRQIKQGAMQELLTGKRRLPGFSGPWETKRLGDLGSFYSGGTPNTSIPEYYGGDIPWITSSDCNAGCIRSVVGRLTPAGVANSATKWVVPGTVLMALYGATAGVVAISEIDATINQAVLAMKMDGQDSSFIFQKLSMLKEWIIQTYTQGGQPNLSGAIVKSIELELPSHDEQVAITTLLSDMDTEIEALESKLAKAREIKQGMMQELLTGKIRLV